LSYYFFVGKNMSDENRPNFRGKGLTGACPVPPIAG
jgi:hypothetical protein